MSHGAAKYAALGTAHGETVEPANASAYRPALKSTLDSAQLPAEWSPHASSRRRPDSWLLEVSHGAALGTTHDATFQMSYKSAIGAALATAQHAAKQSAN